MTIRNIITLNKDTGRLEVPQSSDTYGVPRDVDIASGKNINIDQADGTQGLKIGSTAVGDFGWRDITGQIIAKGGGPTNPPWEQIGTTVFFGYNFAVLDEVWIGFHIPHDYVPGTDVYFHVHFTTDGTNTNDVKFQWDYVYADGFGNGTFNFASPSQATATQTPSGTLYDHYVSESVAQTIPGLEVDGFIYARMIRIANGGTDNTDGVFVVTTDVHYQSNNLATKNKAPNFYT